MARKLTAILAADVVGYSRMMSADKAEPSPRSRQFAPRSSVR